MLTNKQLEEITKEFKLLIEECLNSESPELREDLSSLVGTKFQVLAETALKLSKALESFYSEIEVRTLKEGEDSSYLDHYQVSRPGENVVMLYGYVVGYEDEVPELAEWYKINKEDLNVN